MQLKKENLTEALARLAADRDLILPVKRGDDILFAPWDGRTPPDLSGNAALPPKDMLFPKTEKMYSYDTRSGGVAEAADVRPAAVFGIRPCDVRSIQRLDRVFLEKGYVDTFYQRKREALTVICVACSAPARTCFCESMDGSPGDAEAADLLLRDGGDSFSVTCQSPKGEAVLDVWKDLLAEGEPAVPAPACTLTVARDGTLPQKLMDSFDDDALWAEVSRACIGCGTCSYVCPTCYCFDIGQETQGARGAAFRCWDSCMFSDYSRMAGGHNPRPSKKERLRNRYLHKLSYFDERYGQSLCVGCGRCIEKCPAHLDIASVIERGMSIHV